jgi:hypothetical protein
MMKDGLLRKESDLPFIDSVIESAFDSEKLSALGKREGTPRYVMTDSSQAEDLAS